MMLKGKFMVELPDKPISHYITQETAQEGNQ